MEFHRIQRPLPVLLLILLCLTLLPTTAALECYSHNGVAASSSEFYNATTNGKMIACGTGSTTCCFENQFCDVDLLCHDREDGTVSRQYCSDPDWPAESCSMVCPQFNSAGTLLTPCDDSGEKFCCGDTSDCCDNGDFYQINKTTGQVVAIGTSKVVTSTTPTPTPSASKSAGAAAAATTTSADSNNNGSNGMSEQAKLGIGLGVGLGVPFLGAAAAALFLWRRNQARNSPDGGDDDSPDEMAKVTGSGYAPVPGPGSEALSGSGSVPPYGHAHDTGVASAGAAGSEPGTPGLGGNNPTTGMHVHQLEAESNTRAELGDRGIYELQ